MLKADKVDAGALKRLWNRLGFHEYGPPYEAKRVLVEPGRGKRLEDIGRCDPSRSSSRAA
ncbi:hypothetical protein [Pyrodictium abyssi]|uniref:Uncharacterized protein n=1 Tax=Pyrodictium abyssi TaxID=54256 RepID=A0ABM8IXX7_9CREN|nr:hypothetical protein PABY_13080 [Pyrodictium abyssi]